MISKKIPVSVSFALIIFYFCRCKCTSAITSEGLLAVFASQLMPQKIVFITREYNAETSQKLKRDVYYPKMVIWEHNKGFQEEKSVHFKKLRDLHKSSVGKFSEHVIDRYHWICFNMDLETRIIDLNNISNQFTLNSISRKLWIPNTSKIWIWI